MTTTLIRFTQRQRRTGTVRPCWVSGVSWGAGQTVKSVRFTTDRDQAATFSTATAFAIAAQYYTSPALLELRDGTVLDADTRALLTEQQRRVDQRAAVRAQFAADLRDLFADLPAALRADLLSIGLPSGWRAALG